MISIGTLKMGIEFISVSAPEVKLILPRVTVRNLRPAGLTVTLLAVLQWRLTSPPNKVVLNQPHARCLFRSIAPLLIIIVNSLQMSHLDCTQVLICTA